METPLLFALVQSLTALWHVVAFAGGMFAIGFNYRSLLGLGAYETRWGRRIRQADRHLWLSGFAIIAIGMAASGLESYLANPKLWTKCIVIAVWLASSIVIRRVAAPRMIKGDRTPMLAACSVSLGCWIYGAFLGCAKPLAHGVARFPELLAGFALTLALCMATTFILNARPGPHGKPLPHD